MIKVLYVFINLCYFNSLELKDGRLPDGFNDRRQSWHAEEWQKFAFPVSECILGDLLNMKEFHIWQLVARMTELMFNFRSGWTREHLHLFDKLARRHLVLVEEWRGPLECLITVHNLIHFAEDAIRFSQPDNSWCFVFERCVKRYIEISSNFKNVECTFADTELRRELIKSLELTKNRDVNLPGEIDEERVCFQFLYSRMLEN